MSILTPEDVEDFRFAHEQLRAELTTVKAELAALRGAYHADVQRAHSFINLIAHRGIGGAGPSLSDVDDTARFFYAKRAALQPGARPAAPQESTNG